MRQLSAVSALAVSAALLLSGCSVLSPAFASEEARPHDARAFKAVVPRVPAVPGATLHVGTYQGERGEASYLIEVPDAGWNGTLVTMPRTIVWMR